MTLLYLHCLARPCASFRHGTHIHFPIRRKATERAEIGVSGRSPPLSVSFYPSSVAAAFSIFAERGSTCLRARANSLLCPTVFHPTLPSSGERRPAFFLISFPPFLPSLLTHSPKKSLEGVAGKGQEKKKRIACRCRLLRGVWWSGKKQAQRVLTFLVARRFVIDVFNIIGKPARCVFACTPDRTDSSCPRIGLLPRRTFNRTLSARPLRPCAGSRRQRRGDLCTGARLPPTCRPQAPKACRAWMPQAWRWRSH